MFVYSDECTIKVERRTLPGETEENILKELENIIEKVSLDKKNFQATMVLKR